MERTSTRPDYLVIGHVTRDLLAGGQGVAPGGTVTYSAVTAQRLGLQAAIVTACAPEDDLLLDPARNEGIWVYALPSPATTTFRNVYDAQGHRTQTIAGQASTIHFEDVPPAWRSAPIVHLGPVARELPDDMPLRFPGCLLGVTPQGWMRRWDEAGGVRQIAWPPPTALNDLPANALLVMSVEDVGYNERVVERYAGLAPILVVTQAASDAMVFVSPDEAIEPISEGERPVIPNKAWIGVPAYRASIVDPTGAGDVFAAALLVRYYETRNPVVAAQFAHAVAACAIEGGGTTTIPNRLAAERRMEEDS